MKNSGLLFLSFLIALLSLWLIQESFERRRLEKKVEKLKNEIEQIKRGKKGDSPTEKRQEDTIAVYSQDILSNLAEIWGKTSEEEKLAYEPASPPPEIARTEEDFEMEKKEPVVLSGVQLKKGSYYSQKEVWLEEIPVQEAIFLLYSDGTVKPNKRSFRGYNKASYYQSNDFGWLFEMRDADGGEIVFRQGIALKCMQLQRPALVRKEPGGKDYQLKQKGILLVTERIV